jgi:hypothetical protein
MGRPGARAKASWGGRFRVQRCGINNGDNGILVIDENEPDKKDIRSFFIAFES